MPAYDLIMWAYFCIGFIDFMLKGEYLLDYIILYYYITPNDYKKND